MSDRADLERMVIAMAVNGLVRAEVRATIPDVAWSEASRLFAWTCACCAVRLLGDDLKCARVNGHGVYLAREGRPLDVVRYLLVTAPRLDLDHETEWTPLMQATHEELDLCERIDTFDPSAPHRLKGTT